MSFASINPIGISFFRNDTNGGRFAVHGDRTADKLPRRSVADIRVAHDANRGVCEPGGFCFHIRRE